MRCKIKDEKLESYLKSDIRMLGLPTDFKLEFRGFSKKYYGRYKVNEQVIIVYILDEYDNQLPYHQILDTVLHEAIHHYQHHYEKGFVRLHGVMHNPQFKHMYTEKVSKLREWEVIPCA